MAGTFKWDKHNLACVNTWAFLRGLGQYSAVFSTAGQIKMSELKFYDADMSGDAVQAEARNLALQLDRIFTKALLASYESGYGLAKAVDALVVVMVEGEKTLTDLGEVVDGAYDFRGELK
jgi:hypothetical protein